MCEEKGEIIQAQLNNYQIYRKINLYVVKSAQEEVFRGLKQGFLSGKTQFFCEDLSIISVFK